MINVEQNKNLIKFFNLITLELDRAVEQYPPMHSLHEGHSLIREEYDELWDEIKVKDSKRDMEKIEHELLQLATMCFRLYIDILAGKNE